MRLFVLLSILALSLATAQVQTGSSDPGGVLSQLTVARFVGSGAESIQAMTSDAAGNLYVAGTTSSPDLPMKNAAQPFIGDAMVMRSADRGMTWQKVPNPPALVLTITPHPNETQTLLIGAGDGIYKTSDGGETWRHVFDWIPSGPIYLDSSSFFNIVIDPADPRRIYAYVLGRFTSVRFLVSSDGGESWHPRALPGLPGLSASPASAPALWVDPNGSGTLGLGIWLSRDQGVTWTKMTDPPMWTPSFTVPDTRHTGWIYAETSAGISGRLYLSKDWGATWTERPSPTRNSDSEQLGIGELLFDPDLPDTLYANDFSGSLDISGDAGASWHAASGNPLFLDFQKRSALLSRQCMGGALLVVVSGNRVVSSPDFGASWQPAEQSHVADLAAGPGCAVYLARSIASDAFVAKLAPGGSEVLWSTFLGGSDLDASRSLTLDVQGNVYVAGNTASADFPMTAPRIGPQGQQNVFVVKLDTDGNLIYSVVFGGESSDAVTGLALNTQGEAHLTGSTSSKTFPATLGAFQTQAGANGDDGFAAKLDSWGMLVYASYLPDFAPYSSSPFRGNLPSGIVTVVAEASGSVLIGGNSGILYRMTPDGSNLAPVSRQPGQIYLMETDGSGNVYVAGQTTSGRASGCFEGSSIYMPPGDIFVTKLQQDTLQQSFSARLFGTCPSLPAGLKIGPTGEITLGVWTFGAFPMLNPVLPFENCNPNGCGAVSRLSADGSTLLFSSYVVGAQAPAVALAPDSSVYAAVSAGVVSAGVHAGILRIPVAQPGGLSVKGAFNAFNGYPGYAAPGMLLSITGQNLAPAFIDLGLNGRDPLPTQLGGIQVLFDDIPSAILQVAPDHVICVVPVAVKGKDSVSVQIISATQMATPFFLPVSFDNLGLLTNSFPNLPPAGSVDGNIRNADGTLNDAQHPAAPGSTVTLFGTGLSGAGAVPLLWNAPPPQRYQLISALSGTARHMPGFIDAIYAIDFRIPDAPGPGVYLVPMPGVLTRAEIGQAGSGLGVYVK